MAVSNGLNAILSHTLPGHCGFFSNGLMSASAAATMKQLQFFICCRTGMGLLFWLCPGPLSSLVLLDTKPPIFLMWSNSQLEWVGDQSLKSEKESKTNNPCDGWLVNGKTQLCFLMLTYLEWHGTEFGSCSQLDVVEYISNPSYLGVWDFWIF